MRFYMRIVPITISSLMLRRATIVRRSDAPARAAAGNRGAAADPANLRLPGLSEAYDMPTLFEKIIAGELPATVVFRDSRVIAFLDIRPLAPVHILIAPNKPIPTTDDI